MNRICLSMHLVTRHPFKKPNLVQRPQSIGCAAEHVPHSRWAVWRWRRNRVRLKKCGSARPVWDCKCCSCFQNAFPTPGVCKHFSFHPILWMISISPLQQNPISHVSSGWNRHQAILTLGQSFLDILSHIQIPQKHNIFFCWGCPRIRLPNPTWAETHL